MCDMLINLSLGSRCPDRHDDDDSNKINVTLLSQETFECYNTKFVGETLMMQYLIVGVLKLYVVKHGLVIK